MGFYPPMLLSPSLKVTDMRTPHHLGLHVNDPVYYLNLMGAIVLLRGCGRIQLITRLRMQRPIAYKLMSCTTLTVPFR